MCYLLDEWIFRNIRFIILKNSSTKTDDRELAIVRFQASSTYISS